MEEAFTEIYKKNRWGNGSGSGSNMSPDNKKYIEILEGILKDYGIKTICDIGCGDWRFSQFINFKGCKYLGIDCVKSVIDENKKEYTKKNINFEHKSVEDNYIPSGYDLIIIKDVIQHWEDEDIIKYMNELIKNNKYVFTTNGYKFMRDKSKNELTKRDINNNYRYFPVDINKYPLNSIEMDCLMKHERRAKQMLLLQKLESGIN
tara:strand:- start:2388 stop:3002 length:615 start_codon:yes stop_codon:yes gene_type:complete